MAKKPNPRAHFLQPRRAYEVVSVAQLPAADSDLHRCPLSSSDRQNLAVPGIDVPCAYHAPDWKAATEIALAILDDLTVTWTDKAVAAAAQHLAGNYALGEQAASLLTDPVSPPRDPQNMYSNGRHRLCALRSAGVQRIPIVYDL